MMMPNLDEMLPPHNIEAEQYVLGAILLSEDAFVAAAEHLSPEDFYHSAHQRIFQSMRLMANRGESIDNVTLADQLTRTGELEMAGGMSYVAELIQRVPSATNLASYCRVVRERSKERQLSKLCKQTVYRIGIEPVATLIVELEEKILSLEQDTTLVHGKPIGLLVKEQLHHLQDLCNGHTAITGLPTGFSGLDAVTAGLHPGNLVVIGGRPGMGKTDLALNIASNVALKKEQQALLFSLEMSEAELTNRVLSAQASVDGHALRTGQIDAAGWQRLAEANSCLERAPLTVDDSGSINIAQLRNRCRLHKSKHGLALVVIDYLQLIQGRSDAETREQEVSDLSRSLKRLAKELSVPIIALAQLNRLVESRKPPRPKLADLRESGGIEQDADLVLMLYREEYYDENTERKSLADVLIEKQRNGPLTELQLIYQGKFSRFLDMPTGHQEVGHE